jgi:hypothetical protein
VYKYQSTLQKYQASLLDFGIKLALD